MFMKKFVRYIVFLMVYVDDLLMTGNNKYYIESIKKYLKKCFEMNELGHLHYYLGIEVTQHLNYIFISRKKKKKKLVGELLHRLRMPECNPLSTLMEQKLKLTSSK